jgi:hypothetical protein
VKQLRQRAGLIRQTNGLVIRVAMDITVRCHGRECSRALGTRGIGQLQLVR